MRAPSMQFASSDPRPSGPERLRYERLRLQWEEKSAASQALQESRQNELDDARNLDVWLPHDSEFRGKTLAELADETINVADRPRWATRDLSSELRAARRAAQHRERAAALQERIKVASRQAAALDSLCQACARWLDEQGL